VTLSATGDLNQLFPLCCQRVRPDVIRQAGQQRDPAGTGIVFTVAESVQEPIACPSLLFSDRPKLGFFRGSRYNVPSPRMVVLVTPPILVSFQSFNRLAP
jgi:hypothetical protein